MVKIDEKDIEQEFQDFAKKNFVPPSACRNLGQVKFYIEELQTKIEELSAKFNYVPTSAFILLSKYNLIQNKLISGEL